VQDLAVITLDRGGDGVEVGAKAPVGAFLILAGQPAMSLCSKCLGSLGTYTLYSVWNRVMLLQCDRSGRYLTSSAGAMRAPQHQMLITISVRISPASAYFSSRPVARIN
jgi:hypothetical protein